MQNKEFAFCLMRYRIQTKKTYRHFSITFTFSLFENIRHFYALFKKITLIKCRKLFTLINLQFDLTLNIR